MRKIINIFLKDKDNLLVLLKEKTKVDTSNCFDLSYVFENVFHRRANAYDKIQKFTPPEVMQNVINVLAESFKTQITQFFIRNDGPFIM